jgi:DNA-binding protein H-NS
MRPGHAFIHSAKPYWSLPKAFRPRIPAAFCIVEAKMAAMNLSSLDVAALLKLRADIDNQLQQRRAALQKQLAHLEGLKGAGGGRTRDARKGRKIAPKYRSRKDPTLQWAGRGAVPRWMREEMKGTKLKKDAFLIKR